MDDNMEENIFHAKNNDWIRSKSLMPNDNDNQKNKDRSELNDP